MAGYATVSLAAGAGPKLSPTTVTVYLPYRADPGASMVKVAGGIPSFVTETAIEATPSTMHCWPGRHRLSLTTDL